MSSEKDTYMLLLHPSRKLTSKRDLLYRRELLTPSLGLAAISAYCRGENISCQIIDLRLPHRTVEDVVDCLKRRKPILVGITAFTDDIVCAGKLASFIKRSFPEQKIAVGGPHATCLPEQTLKEFSAFDFVIVGEGEKTVVDLTHALQSNNQGDLLNVKGIALRDNGKVVLLPAQPVIEDLDTLPNPAWDLFELEHYSRFLMVNASRGCPYHCYFCNPNYLGKPRLRKGNKVADEIEYLLRRFDIQKIQFADATMGISKQFIIDICDSLIARDLSKVIQWICETRADKLDRVLLEKMKKAGCKLISLGAESGSERILSEVIHKAEGRDDIARAVSTAKEIGLKVRCFFTLGHPGETEAEIMKTLRFATELNPDLVSFGLVVPYPGTELREMAKKCVQGTKILHNQWDEYNQLQYSCYETQEFTLKELKKRQAEAYFYFYSRHPLKALSLLSDIWGYTPVAIAKIFAKLWSALLRR